MKHLLNNILSVLLWQPDRYRAFRHEAQVAALSALATTGLGLWLFGLPALFVVGFAYLVALITFPCKILMTDNVPPAALATESVFARGIFAGSVSTWPVAVALGAGLPPLLIAGIALHAAFQIWMQVLPRQDFAPSRLGARAAALAGQQRPDAVPPRFRQAGPPVGTFRGREIPSWLLDHDGLFHDFVGCTSDLRHFVAAPGQTVLGTGLVYEVRRGAANSQTPVREGREGSAKDANEDI